MPVDFEVTVGKVGNSLRITIPKEVCKAADLKEWSTVGLIVTNGDIRVRKIR